MLRIKWEHNLLYNNKEKLFSNGCILYADSVKCLNNFCAGKQQCLRDRMAKVRLLEISTLQAEGILDEQDVTNLYNRLQCLIDLKIDLTIPN